MVNLRRAVVLACFVLFCVIAVIYGFATSNLYAASVENITIKGGAALEGGEVWNISNLTSTNGDINADVVNAGFYSFAPYLQLSYSTSSLKSEMKFHFNVDQSTGALAGGVQSYVVLDKAYVRFRVPTFGNNKLTVIAGNAPISWGMGQLYRGGDLLFSSAISNEEAGQDNENTLWVAAISHPLLDGCSLEFAFVPAVEEVKKEKIGVLVKFSLDNLFPALELLKELRFAYVYSDSTHRASALVDLNLYFDINVAIETSFRASNDFRVVANVFKAFSIDGEYESHSLNLYLSYQGDFYKEEQDLSVVLSYALTDRTTISLLQSNTWTSGEYSQLTGSLYTTTTIANGVDVTILGALTTKPNISPSIYNIVAGARIKYSF